MAARHYKEIKISDKEFLIYCNDQVVCKTDCEIKSRYIMMSLTRFNKE